MPTPAEPGSLLPFGRRVVALIIDWAVALGSAALIPFDHPLLTLAVFALEQVLLVGTLGTSIGHRIAGGVVIRNDGQRAVLWRALVRTVLLCIVIPVLIVSEDGRGAHDMIAGTRLIQR